MLGFLTITTLVSSVASSKSSLKAIVEEKSVDETHVFTVSRSVEYFVKFEVPGNLKEKYKIGRAHV